MSGAGAGTSALRLEDTVQVESVGHRLAMGVQWLDALSGSIPGSAWTSMLEAIGVRSCPSAFDGHPMGRHALPAAGRVAKLLVAGAKDKTLSPPATPEMDQTNFVLRAYGSRDGRLRNYATGSDPRFYVPRRLSLTPVQSGGWPTATAGNIRTAWLWPGSTYPVPSTATALRGRVQRGTSLATAKPIAWARIVVTRTPTGNPPPNFLAETKIAFGHGDDRGEFLAVFGPSALPGTADLPASFGVRVWAFVPPTDPFDADNPLASLPLEVAGTATIGDLLRGTQPPSTYIAKPAIDIPALAPGTIFTMNEATLLFV